MIMVAPEGEAPPVRVLLIEDDAAHRTVMLGHLERSGIDAEADATSDVVRGMEMARSGDFDCVFLDSRFPSGDAFQIFSELFAQSAITRPPIVVLTGEGEENRAAEGMKRGAQGYLTKSSVGPDSIRLAIESALEKAAHARDVADRDAQLTRLSFYDALTGLPNRRLFLDRLEQAVRALARTGERFAVLMMDLDLFKQVNDSYGHEAGDRLLVQVADRLRSVVRGTDTVARLGGDEFAALLSTANSLEGALVVAHKICDAVGEPITVGDHDTRVGISMGIVMCPDHADASNTVVRYADRALYQSKASGAGITVYGDTAGSEGREAAMIAQGLQGAIVRDELFTMFQPQVRLRDGAVVGVEALVRWRHPQLGLLPAGKFIPAAERSDVIEALTHRVLNLALTQSRAWRAEGVELTISVNLSARLLDRHGLVERIDQAIREADVAPQTLCLEVTETGIMRCPEAAELTLHRLANLGVRLSIDDFGTGYSSLKYLRMFPINEIKIDRLFVDGLGGCGRDAVIVESVLALGGAFGVRVIAEGIETDTAWSRLAELGCEYGQGYRIGRPMNAVDFDRWHQAWVAEPALPGTFASRRVV